MLKLDMTEIQKNMMKWYAFHPEAKTLVIGDAEGILTLALQEEQLDLLHVQRPDEIPEESLFEYILLYNTEFADVLEGLRGKLYPEGKILLLSDNRLGLRYFSGEADVHTGHYFSGINDYADNPGTVVRGYSREELVRIIRSAGYENYKFYYPYPNETMVKEVFTDMTLEEFQYGREYLNYDVRTVELFSEARAAQAFREEGVIASLANYFIVEICISGEFTPVIYAKINSFRKPDFQIVTVINEQQGKRTVEKYGMNPMAVSHVKKMLSRESAAYMRETEKGVASDFFSCPSLDQKISEYIEKRDAEQVVSEVRDFYRPYLEAAEEGEYFDKSFEEVFGIEGRELDEVKKLKTVCPANIDLICDNIMLTDQGYRFIDQEWIFDFQVPVLFILWRCVRELYAKHLELEELIPYKVFLQRFSVSMKLDQIFLRWTLHFVQDYVGTGRYENGAVPRKMINIGDVCRSIYNVSDAKLYLDMGEGFSEEQALQQPLNADEQGDFRLIYHLPKGVEKLRWDPVEVRCCRCRITEINGTILSHNGMDTGKGQKFENGDPQYEISLLSKDQNQLEIKGQIEIQDLFGSALVYMRKTKKYKDISREQKRRIVILEQQTDQVRQELETLRMSHNAVEQRCIEMEGKYDQLYGEYDRIINSKSWKLIVFLRKILKKENR